MAILPAASGILIGMAINTSPGRRALMLLGKSIIRATGYRNIQTLKPLSKPILEKENTENAS